MSNSYLANALLGAIVLASTSALAGEVPPAAIVSPGAELAFTAPDGVGEQSTHFTPGSSSLTNPTETMLGALLTSIGPNARGVCEVTRHNDFAVEGAFFQSDVSSWITGHVDVIGVLQMMGAGEVGNTIVLEVIDLGADPAVPTEGKLVIAHPISSLELATSWDPDAGFAISVDLGSATLVQSGGEVGAGISVPIRRRVVRDNVDFGFAAPLQRGHLYRLRLKMSLASRLDVRGGTAKASFYFGSLGLADVADAILDPQVWSANMDLPFLKRALPNIKPHDLGLGKLFQFPELKAPDDVPSWGGFIFFEGAGVNMVTPYDTFHQILDALDFPKDLPGLFASPTFGFGPALSLDESILNSGLALSNLAIRVASDPIEDEMRLLVERNLARENQKSPIASFQLPLAHGGKLEFARKVIGELVASYSEAGASGKAINKALTELEHADKKYVHGKWKEAYAGYRRAYHHLSQ